MCFDASAAKRIMSTAPIAKFGQKRTFAPVEARAAASTSQPLVPTTACTPAATAARTLSSAGVGLREVDEHVGVAEHVGDRGVERGVGAAGQLHVVGALDRAAHRLPHAAGGAGHGDADACARRAPG